MIRKGRARLKILTIFKPLSLSLIWLSQLSVLLISTPQQVFGRLQTPHSGGSWTPTILEPPIRHPCHKITAEATSTTTIINFPDLSSLSNSTTILVRRSYKTIITVIIIPLGSEPKGKPAGAPARLSFRTEPTFLRVLLNAQFPTQERPVISGFASFYTFIGSLPFLPSKQATTNNLRQGVPTKRVNHQLGLLGSIVEVPRAKAAVTNFIKNRQSDQ